MTILGLTDDALRAQNGFWTATEISQQAEMLRQTQKGLVSELEATNAFLEPVLAQSGIRIIFTGAGTSAFVGECLAPIFMRELGKRCEAISTTDLVSAPEYYFEEDTPTLLVSFARSGNSPESVAAVNIGNEVSSNIQHLFITCNTEGELMQLSRSTANAHAILLPEKTHDKSFAMTSSFTSMLFAALSTFVGPVAMNERAEKIAQAVQVVLDKYSFMLRAEACNGYERVVYLGSHAFKGIARESALKLLELTDGDTVAMYDSPMGFRHGPKTIVNDKTLVVIFLSNDPYTRQYDLDLLSELRSDGVASVIAISAQHMDSSMGDKTIVLADMEYASDQDLLVPFMVAPQILAFYQSLELGHAPDCPDTTGRVNRVVQGVKIHAVS